MRAILLECKLKKPRKLIKIRKKIPRYKPVIQFKQAKKNSLPTDPENVHK